MLPGMTIIDLSHELYSGMPQLDGVMTAFWENFSFEGLSRLSDGRLNARSRIIHMAEHTGTHLDAPGHFDPAGRNVEEIPLEDLILPGHLLDLRHKKAHDAIGPDDFAQAAVGSGRPVTSGTIVIAYTGQDKLWGQDGFTNERPYVTEAGALWLVERGVTLFGTDLIGIDNPAEWWDPTHLALVGNGVPVIQQLNNLEPLLGREFLFEALPLPMRGGTASPVRAIALVDE
jgi:arylformamidase